MIIGKSISGNEKAARYLDKILEKGRISHAYLFEGPRQVGKMTAALAFAGGILEEQPERLGAHPDFLHIFPDKEEKQIGVGAARQLQKDLSLYPFKARYKVAVIERAEMLSASAANALLKTLEEPGETSVVILVTSDLEKILPTIRSRCQILAFNPVADDKIKELLVARGIGEKSEKILEIAAGRPGLALALAQEKGLLERMEKDGEMVRALFSQSSHAKMEKISFLYDMEKEEAAAVLDGWMVVLRREMLKSMEEQGSLERRSTEKMKTAIDRTAVAREDILERNVNLRLALENLVLSFK